MGEPIALNVEVLVVMDDSRATNGLSQELARSRFQMDVCQSVGAAVEKLRLRRYDAVIVDLPLAPIDALHLALELRRGIAAPALILSRDATSPRAPLGRASMNGEPPGDRGVSWQTVELLPEKVLRFGDFVIDLGAMRATVGLDAIALTPTEFKLLVALAGSSGQVLSRDELLLRVWSYPHADGDDRLVDVHVGRLRKKLRRSGVNEVVIETARGFGYRLMFAGTPGEPRGPSEAPHPEDGEPEGEPDNHREELHPILTPR